MLALWPSSSRKLWASEMICTDYPPEPGCGNILTDEERHYYETSCEICTRRWDDRIDAWRRGGADVDLDKMFDAPRQLN